MAAATSTKGTTGAGERVEVTQPWLDRAVAIEAAADALYSHVKAAIDRAEAGTGRLYAANVVQLTAAMEELACALNAPEAAIRRLAIQPTPSASEAFQAKVQPWLLACFGEKIAGDREERNHRFLEEALELVQASGCTASEAHQLVDYVYGRPVGEVHQEIGGVMVTLAALCLANDADMHAAGWVELERIWGGVEKIRAKQAAKPKHSPLPQHVLAPIADEKLRSVLEPWANHNGPLPEYDHPAACVFDSGVQHAVEMLAKELDVDDWSPCEGTEEYDGDLGGTLMNIVLAAMPKDEHGDAMYPSEVRAALGPARARSEDD